MSKHSNSLRSSERGCPATTATVAPPLFPSPFTCVFPSWVGAGLGNPGSGVAPGCPAAQHCPLEHRRGSSLAGAGSVEEPFIAHATAAS